MVVQSQYNLQTRQLLSYPSATTKLYSDTDINGWVNRARVQLAGETECIRNYATLTLAVGVRSYNFSSIVLSAPATGIQGIFNARYVWYQVGAGQISLRPRPWPWFAQYHLNNPVPKSGPPSIWSQYGQGESGSLFFDPLPDVAYVCPVDTVCLPMPLVDDTTVEAIPDPYTNAVPFFAAYLALLSAQSGARESEAERMLKRYDEWRDRQRKISNATILPGIYEQAPNPTILNQLGVKPAGQGGG